MADDLPWTPPTDYVAVARRWKYAPPPQIMFDAVVNDMETWSLLHTGETPPVVAASRRPDAVLFQPWVDSLVTAVELRIDQDGLGSAITVLAYGEAPKLSDETRRWARYRLGNLFGAALREWVDEPRR